MLTINIRVDNKFAIIITDKEINPKKIKKLFTSLKLK